MDILRTKMKIVAVTVCSTGIQHTYMAAKALEKAIKNPRDIVEEALEMITL